MNERNTERIMAWIGVALAGFGLWRAIQRLRKAHTK